MMPGGTERYTGKDIDYSRVTLLALSNDYSVARFK